MNTGEWIALIVGLFLIAIGIATYLLIRNTSPVELEIRKKHTEQLKAFLLKLQSYLQGIQIDELINSCECKSFFMNTNFESDPLFNDIQNHVKNVDINHLWAEVKSKSVEIEEKRLLLVENITKGSKSILKRYRLVEYKFVDNLEVCQGFTEIIYRNAINIARGKMMQESQSFVKMPHQSAQPGRTWCELKANGYTICKIYCTNLVDSQKAIDKIFVYATDLLVTTIANMKQKETSEYEYVEKASKIIQLSRNLQAHITDILDEIQELLNLPLLPGNCKYLKKT